MLHQSQLQLFSLHFVHRFPLPLWEERARVRGRAVTPRPEQALTPTLSRATGEGEKGAAEEWQAQLLP